MLKAVRDFRPSAVIVDPFSALLASGAHYQTVSDGAAPCGLPQNQCRHSALHQICQEHLHGRYSIEVIDLLEHPQLAAGDQIIALPTLVRRLPPPIKKILGDLSNQEHVLVGLDVRPHIDTAKAPCL